MAVTPQPTSIDRASRFIIFSGCFFSLVGLTLAIVGCATVSWFRSEQTDGSFTSYNLFTNCSGNSKTSSSYCADLDRQTTFGQSTQTAAAFLVVSICLLGCAVFITIAMHFVLTMKILLFVGPICLFLATLFLLATFAEASRVMMFTSYSAHLVQTAHMASIFALALLSFVCGRLHYRFYERFQ